MSYPSRMDNLVSSISNRCKNRQEKDDQFEQICDHIDDIIAYQTEKRRQNGRLRTGNSMYSPDIDEDMEKLNAIRDAAYADVAKSKERAIEAMEIINDMCENENVDPIFDFHPHDHENIDEIIQDYLAETYDIDPYETDDDEVENSHHDWRIEKLAELGIDENTNETSNSYDL